MKELANESCVINSGKIKVTVTFDDRGEEATASTKIYLADDSYGQIFNVTELIEDLQEHAKTADNLELYIEPSTYYYGDAVVSIWLVSERKATEEEKKSAAKLIRNRQRKNQEIENRRLAEKVAELKAAGYKVSKEE